MFLLDTDVISELRRPDKADRMLSRSRSRQALVIVGGMIEGCSVLKP